MSVSKPPLDELRIERGAEREPESKTWMAVAAAVIVLVLALVAIVWHSRSGGIVVHTAVARELGGGGSGSGERTVLNASGYVTARRAATVSSKVTGKVIEVLIEEGMKVKEGQVVARLDDTNVKTSLDVAQAQLESAKAALDETRAQLKQAESGISARHRTGQTTHRVPIRPGPGRIECQIAAGAPGAAGTWT